MPVDVADLQSLKHLAVVPAAGLADLARASYVMRLSRGSCCSLRASREGTCT